MENRPSHSRQLGQAGRALLTDCYELIKSFPKSLNPSATAAFGGPRGFSKRGSPHLEAPRAADLEEDPEEDGPTGRRLRGTARRPRPPRPREPNTSRPSSEEEDASPAASGSREAPRHHERPTSGKVSGSGERVGSAGFVYAAPVLETVPEELPVPPPRA